LAPGQHAVQWKVELFHVLTTSPAWPQPTRKADPAFP
jgi:hypothetical protein